MTHRHAASQQRSFTTVVAVTILAVAAIDTFGADQEPGTATYAAAGTNQASVRPSVARELKKLFHESGQQMPSMRMADLPYTSTPRMDRVRKREEQPSHKAGKPRLIRRFSRMLSRFREDRSKDHAVPLIPPAIVLKNDAHMAGHRSGRLSPTARQIRSPQATIVANNRTGSVSPSAMTRGHRSKAVKPIRPVSQPHKMVVSESRAARTTHRPPKKHVNPFEVAVRTPEREKNLHLNTVADTPVDIEFNAVDRVESGTVCREDVEQGLREPGPFSGLRINAQDEFINPFEYSNAVADRNELNLNLPDDELLNIGLEPLPEMPAAVPNEFEYGTVENSQHPGYFTDQHTEPAETQRQADVGPANQWRPRSSPRRTSVPVRPVKSRVRNGRLAVAGQTPAKPVPADSPQSPGSYGDPTSETEDSITEDAAKNSDLPNRKSSAPLTRQQRIEARRHLSGFMGFCPVELRDSRDLVDSSDEYQSRFGLNTYHFSSAAARDRFDANPSRYAPAAGGADVVVLVNSGEQHAGSLQFAMWYRDRLYLFHSRITMLLFREDPARFADHY